MSQLPFRQGRGLKFVLRFHFSEQQNQMVTGFHTKELSPTRQEKVLVGIWCPFVFTPVLPTVNRQVQEEPYLKTAREQEQGAYGCCEMRTALGSRQHPCSRRRYTPRSVKWKVKSFSHTTHYSALTAFSRADSNCNGCWPEPFCSPENRNGKWKWAAPHHLPPLLRSQQDTGAEAKELHSSRTPKPAFSKTTIIIFFKIALKKNLNDSI